MVSYNTMVKKDYVLKILINIVLAVLFTAGVYASEDRALYYEGIRDARHNNIDFAFIIFDNLARDYPSSRYFEDALFATGEYRFLINDYTDSRVIFNKIVSSPENTKVKLFAYAYLMKLCEKTGCEHKVYLGYKKNVLTFKQISLLFRNSQEVTYTSALQKVHKAVYFIDKVVVYIDNEAFLTIHF